MGNTIITKLESGRAQMALKAVEEIKDESYSGNFKTYAKKLGPMILSSGLGQSLAFVWAKSGDPKDGNDTKKAYFVLLKCVVKYLQSSQFLPKDLKQRLGLTKGVSFNAKKDFAEFFKGIVDLSLPEYSMLEREVLAYVKWLSRFSDALIEKPETNEE